MPYYAAGGPPGVVRRMTRRQWSMLWRRIARAQMKVAKRSLAPRFIKNLKMRLR